MRLVLSQPLGLLKVKHCVLLPRFQTISSYLHLNKREIKTMSTSEDQSTQRPSDTKEDITKWASEDGRFKRPSSAFRDVISPAGKFQPEKGRYYLYVSLACPWAHRTLISMGLKGLNSIIGVSVVHPHLGAQGWSWSAPQEFNPKFEGVIPDPLFSFDKLRELYFKANPHYEGRFTVPVLFDSKLQTIVNNESSEIIRMLNSSFNAFLDKEHQDIDLYPLHLRDAIDQNNKWIYDQVNNGVYKAGFATTQEAYEEAVIELFKGLDKLEEMLKGKKYLIGDQLTEADIRLFTTIIRFDVVYVQHFKCNLRTIRDGYPHLHTWLRSQCFSFLLRWEIQDAFLTVLKNSLATRSLLEQSDF